MPIYLACGPEETLPALPPPYAPARLGFRLAADYPSLLGPDLPADARQGYLILQDDMLPPYEPTPALAKLIVDLCRESFAGLVCDFDRPQAVFWQTLIQQLGGLCAAHSLPMLVPESYASEAPHALVMLSPGVPAAGFSVWLGEAAARYAQRAVLQLLPTRLELTLPCPSGAGRQLSGETLQALLATHHPALFRDDALLCEYFGYLTEQTLHFVLFDSAQTLAQKAALAETVGCVGVIGLYQELKDMI